MRHGVINHDAKLAVWQAARSSICAEKDTPDSGFRVYSTLDEGFWAILGSLNGANSICILREHHVLIGHRTVERIVALAPLECADVELPRCRSVEPDIKILQVSLAGSACLLVPLLLTT